MTKEELEMRKLVRESDVIDKTDGTELAKAFNYLWEKYVEQESVLDKIRAEIEQVKSIMNEEIINHNREDLTNFVNGLNQSLMIIDKYRAESEKE